MAAPLRLGRAARSLPAAAARVAASQPLPRLSSSSSRRSAPLPAMQAFQYPEVYRDEAAVSTAGAGAARRAPDAPRTRNSDSGAPRRPERLCRREASRAPFRGPLSVSAWGWLGAGMGRAGPVRLRPCGAGRGARGRLPARLGNAGPPGCLRGTAGFSVMVRRET